MSIVTGTDLSKWLTWIYARNRRSPQRGPTTRYPDQINWRLDHIHREKAKGVDSSLVEHVEANTEAFRGTWYRMFICCTKAKSWLTFDSKEYDHSFMHHDCQMYYLPNGEESWEVVNNENDPKTWMKPMTALKESSIVEVPANWHLGKVIFSS